MNLKLSLCFLLLAACGTKKVEPQHPVQPTDPLKLELQAEIARITPNLKWCRGLAVPKFGLSVRLQSTSFVGRELTETEPAQELLK